MSPNILDKRAWSRAKRAFYAASAPGMAWEDLTDEQRQHWYHRAAEDHEDCGAVDTVTVTLWQVTVIEHGGRQFTLYLDAGVQGIPTHTDALRWVADNLPSHERVNVMAITYQVVPR